MANGHGVLAWGSAERHERTMNPSPNRRRKCRCGCGGRVTHVGTANGVALMSGCEWTVRKWVQAQDQRKLAEHRAKGRN